MINDLSTIRSFSDLRIYYFKYKDTPQFALGLIGLIGFLCLVIIIRLVVPQSQSWLSLQTQVKEEQDKLALLQVNQKLLATMNPNQLAESVTLVTDALPYQKDFTGVITAIDEATLISGVRRDDYSFQVGDLATKSAQLSPETAISVKITLRGKVSQLQHFLEEMNKRMPLSETVTVAYGNEGATVDMIFFYKYLPASLQIAYTDPLRTVSPQNQQLLKTLSEWKKPEAPPPASTVSNTQEEASSSAN